MKKPSFPSWVVEQLTACPMTDEQLCGNYIRIFYEKPLWFHKDYTTYATYGKKYESCRKMLSEMRRLGKVIEISRETRKNKSAEILFKLP